jgi:GNAT superfamily N-acetyltransferase
MNANATVRTATTEDALDVRRVLDAAMLDTDAADLSRRIDGGTVLVAVSDAGTVLGALVAVPREEGVHVEALAVRRARRGAGIGTALVERAAGRWERLTAEFDPELRPFYDALGFAIEERGERCWGVR